MVQDQQHYYYAMGKRKTSVAQVRLYTDTGINQVNGKPLEEVFPWDSWQQLIQQPFDVTNAHGQFRIVAKIRGGGVVSQAGALRHGIARALQVADPALRRPLKRAGLLTRDAREKERKKYGLARARKAKQWTKR
jgi:small subunit ribosomal protein S9